MHLKDRMLYYQFIPHMTMLGIHLLWHVKVRPFRTSDPLSGTYNIILMVILQIQVGYFLFIECLQMKAGFEDYIKDLMWNVIDCSPLLTIVF